MSINHDVLRSHKHSFVKYIVVMHYFTCIFNSLTMWVQCLSSDMHYLLQRGESQERLVHRINSSGVGDLGMKNNEHVNELSNSAMISFLGAICSFRAAIRHIHAWKI